MKRIILLLSIVLIFCLYGCTKKSCRCTYTAGDSEIIKIGPNEECSDYNMELAGSGVNCVEE
jgi:hypothetical protein